MATFLSLLKSLIAHAILFFVLWGGSLTSLFAQGGGTALRLDGSNDYIQANDVTISLATAQAFTLETWFKPDASGSGSDVIFSVNTSGGGNVFFIAYTASLQTIRLYQEGVGTDTGTTLIAADQWHHLALVHDQANNVSTLYIDGVEELQSTGAAQVSASDQFSIGQEWDGVTASDHFKGEIDETRVWGVARTPTDIWRNMHLISSSGAANLISMWRFSEGSGITVDDPRSGYDAALVGISNSAWVTSTLPFGSGTVSAKTPSVNGSVVGFGQTGLEMTFMPGSVSAPVAVTKLTGSPNQLPSAAANVTFFSSQYWVTHRFATSSFTADLTFALDAVTSNRDYVLYGRVPTSDGAWTQVGVATEVNTTTNKVTFSGVTELGQFILAERPVPPEVVSLSPVDGTTNLGLLPRYELRFNQAMAKGSGTITIRSGGAVVEQIDVASGAVGVAGNVVTVTPSVVLSYETSYAVQVSSGSFTSVEGVAWAGIVDDAAWNFTTGPVPSVSAGRSALALDGSHAYVIANSVTAPLATAQSYTLEAWFKPDASGTGSDIILSTHTSGGNNIFFIAYNHTTQKLRLFHVNTDLQTSTSLGADQWHHVALVEDGITNTSRLYVNGVEELSVSGRAQLASSSQFSIGQEWDGVTASDHFKGEIDEVRIWTTARTATDIQRNMHLVSSSGAANLLAMWRFDEASGTTANDPANNHDATLVNNALWSTSAIPFGSGTTSVQTPATGTPTTTFGSTGITLAFSANSAAEAMGITKLTGAPNQLPTPVSGFSMVAGTYWVGHRFGSGAFAAEMTIAAPKRYADYVLYRRGERAEDASWVQVGGVSRADATTQEVTFSGVTELGQFILAERPVPPEVVSLSPVDGTTNLGLLPRYELRFNQAVAKGSGTITIRSGGAVVEQIDVASGAVEVAGNVVTVTPSVVLSYETSYAVQVSSGSFTSVEGVAWSGIADDAAWNFTTSTSSRGNALHLDGANDYVTANGVIASLAAASTYTLETWFKADAASTGQDIILAINRADGSSTVLLILDHADGTIRVSQPGSGVKGTTVLANGQWHHIAFTADLVNNIGRLYLNGVEELQVTATGQVLATDLFSIGQEWDGGMVSGNYFRGEIDEVRIWTGVRSQAEIRSMMHRVAQGMETGLLAYWPFFASSGSVAYDARGAHNGVLHGDASFVASTAPLGPGETAVATEQRGSLNFGNTGLEMNFFSAGSADIHVSRIDEAVYSPPTGALPTSQQRYWIVNRFGSGLFNTTLTFAMPTGTFTASDANLPGQIKLYSRSTGSDGVWSQVAEASHIDANTQTATFENIRSFSQFVLARGTLLAEGAVMASTTLEAQVEVDWTNAALDEDAALLRLHRREAMLVFDGIRDEVNFGDVAAFDALADFTIEGWMNISGFDTRSANRFVVPISKGAHNGPSGWAFLVRRSDANASFDVYLNGGGTPDLSGSFSLTPQMWAHFAVTRIGTALHIYINGTQVAEANIPEVVIDTSSPLRLGGQDGSLYDFQGALAEMRVWTVGRTEQQIRSTMAAPLEGNEAGLLSYWPFHGQSSSLIEDKVGTANGTNSNANRPDFDLLSVMAAEETRYADATALPQRSYQYCLELMDGADQVINTSCTIGHRFLHTPLSATGTVGTDLNKVVITWVDRSAMETGYRVYRQEQNNEILLPTTRQNLTPVSLDANTERYEDLTALPGQAYSYCIVPVFEANGAVFEATETCTSGTRAQVLPPASFAVSDGQYAPHPVLTWTSVSNADTYRITRDGNQIATPSTVVEGSTGTYTDTGATAGIAHTYCIVAVSGSATSEALAACDTGGSGILPGPLNLAATNGTYDDRVELTWADPFSPGTAYQPVYDAATRTFRIYRRNLAGTDSVLVHTAPANTDTYVDQASQANVTYRYCLVTVSTASGSEVVSAPTCANGKRVAVLAVDEVTATDDTYEDRIDITWSTSASTVNLFKVFRNGVLVKTVAAGNARFYSDRLVASDSTYTYCVSAVTLDGSESTYGTTLAGTCDTGRRDLNPPTDVAASDDAEEETVTITWVDNSQVEAGYYVYRRPANTTDSLLLSITSQSSVSYIDATGEPGITYYYSILPFDAHGPGTVSHDTGRRTLLAPSTVQASNGTAETVITLTWEDNSVAESGYRILRKVQGSNNAFAAVTETPLRTTNYTDTGLIPGVAFTYAVEAFDAYGSSARVEVDGSTVLLAPASFYASGTYADRVELVWVDVSEHNTGYKVFRDGTEVANLNNSEASHYRDDTASGLHTYSVQAVGAAGGLSNAVATTGGLYMSPAVTKDALVNAEKLLGDYLATGRKYGAQVSVDGNWTVVRSDSSKDLLWFFKRDGRAWIQQQKIVSSDTGNERAIALSGNYAVHALSSTTRVYELQGDAWVAGPLLDRGGDHVAMSGAYAVVVQNGTASHDPADVHIYKRTGTSWARQVTLALDVRYGRYPAMDGSTIIVPAARSLGSANSESDIYVFTRQDETWERRTKLVFDVNIHDADLDQDRAVVSFSSGRIDLSNSGALILERNHQDVWVPHDTVRVAITPVITLQENRVALQGESLWLGYPHETVEGINYAGRVYLFQKRKDTWHEVAQVNAIDPQEESGGNRNFFADDIAFDGNTVVFGAPGANGGATRSGAAYLQTMLPMPENLSVSDGSLANRVQLTWTDKALYEDGYRVYRKGPAQVNFEELGTTTANEEVFNDFDAAPGVLYAYCVAAFNNDLATTSSILGESLQNCDYGYRPANGAISGRIAAQEGAGIASVEVCTVPTTANELVLQSALLFDGVDSGATIANNEHFNFNASGAFTVEAWVRPSVGNSTEQHIVSQWGTVAPGESAFRLALNGNRTVFIRTSDGSTTYTAQSSAVIPENAWTHIAGTYDGTHLRIYINGVEQQVVAAESPQHSLAYDLMLGRRPEGGFLYKGLLDEVRLWNVARSSEALLGSKNQPLTGDEDGLVGYWPIEQGQGEAVADLSGNGLHGTFSKGVYWSNEVRAPMDSCVPTDAEGNYTIAGLRYGSQATFQVMPTDTIRSFQPALKNITLSTESPVQNEINFTDVSSFTISGVIQYTGTTQKGNSYTCPVEDVRLFVDETYSSDSESDGAFAIAADLGPRVIRPSLEVLDASGNVRVNHAFTPASRTLDIQADQEGITFVDDTRHMLGVQFQGGCGRDVGRATVRIFSANSCLVEEVTVGGASGMAQLSLPPQKYFVQVVDIEDVPSGLEKADVLAFFDAVGVQEVDLTTQSDTLVLAYQAPLRVRFTGFDAHIPSGSCSSGIKVLAEDGTLTRTLPQVPVLAQNESLALAVEVVEDYGTGGTCPIEAGTVTVNNGFDSFNSTLELAIEQGQAAFNAVVGAPNLTEGLTVSGVDRSYQQSVSAVVKVAGRDAITETQWVIVEGSRPRPSTFTSVITGVQPLFVLHDPPGDNSYSYLEEGTTICNSISRTTLVGGAGGGDLDIGVGFKAGVGLGVSVENGAGLVVNTRTVAGQEDGTLREPSLEVCATTTEQFATSASPDMVGREADVFVGAGFNLLFAATDVLGVNETTCELVRSENIAVDFDDDPIETLYTYTQKHLVETVLPQHEQLLANTSSDGIITLRPSETVTLASSLENWRHVLRENEERVIEGLESAEENRSFNAGASFESAATLDSVSVTDWMSTRVYIASESAIGATFTALGYDQTVLAAFEVNREWVTETTQTETTSRTAGYVLDDDDAGDYFSLNVGTDAVYKTPVFGLVSGASSAPWEPGQAYTNTFAACRFADVPCALESATGYPFTQARDKLALTINPPNQSNIPPNELATFTLGLSNLSDTGEEREYQIVPIAASNIGGAVMRAQGLPIHAGVPFTVSANQTQEITLTVERGPRRYIYDNLQIVAVAPGELEAGTILNADTVAFRVAYEAPCSPISFVRPTTAWSYGAHDASLDIIVQQLLLDSPDLNVSEVGLQYRRQGESDTDWKPIVRLTFVPAASLTGEDAATYQNGMFTGTAPDGSTLKLDPSKTAFSTTWSPPDNVNGGDNDGEYELQGYTSCSTNNTVYSDILSGVVDRSPPKLFGPAEPADAALHIGDVISATFVEDIACNTVHATGNDQNIALTAPDGNDVDQDPDRVPISVACDGRTLLAEPQVPLGIYEGQMLTMTLVGGARGLTDVRGNRFEKTEGGMDFSWSFTVQQSAFAWNPRTLDAQLPFGQDATLTADLHNGKAQSLDFTLGSTVTLTRVEDADGNTVSAPSVTITPSLTSGTLDPSGSKRVSFSLPNTLALGRFRGTLNASSTTEGSAPLYFDVQVGCFAPQWSVTPSDFEYTMTITGQLAIDGVTSTDSQDVVAAIVDGEVRGMTNVEQVTLGSTTYNLVNLIIYSNAPFGEQVTFQVYDASACQLHTETSKTYTFQADVSYGQPAQPITIQAPPPPSTDIPLAAGWTWVSVNKTPTTNTAANRHPNAVLRDEGLVEGSPGDVIKNQTQFSLYDHGSQAWIGSLTELQPGQAYQVKLGQNSRLRLSGTDAALTGQIALQQGWNWIGYLPQEALFINDALANVTAQTGDLIKSQVAFAQYVEGAGWIGSLKQLDPGYGYLMRMQGVSPGALDYPDPANVATKPSTRVLAMTATQLAQQRNMQEEVPLQQTNARSTEETESGKQMASTRINEVDESAETEHQLGPGWIFDPVGYQHTMNIVATLEADGFPIISEGSVVAAWVGDEARGLARVAKVEALGVYQAFLTVYSNGGRTETVRFTLYDGKTGAQHDADATLMFEKDAIEGSVSEPVLLSPNRQAVATAEALPTTFVLAENYPNPFNPQTTIQYALPEASDVTIVVYDMLGRVVSRLVDQAHEAGRYTVTFDATNLASGTYIYRMQAGAFQQVQRMVLVK